MNLVDAVDLYILLAQHHPSHHVEAPRGGYLSMTSSALNLDTACMLFLDVGNCHGNQQVNSQTVNDIENPGTNLLKFLDFQHICACMFKENLEGVQGLKSLQIKCL